MKTKTYLRYISCVLAVLLCVASIMPIAFADSTNHGNSESLLTGSNYSVSYSMNGKDVVEQLTIRDGGITRITRTVHPNDVMDIVVVGASGESTTSTARSDYLSRSAKLQKRTAGTNSCTHWKRGDRVAVQAPLCWHKCNRYGLC